MAFTWSRWGHNSRALFDRHIVHGVDGSILSDGDLVYVVADEHPVECRILRIDYFHGHDPVKGPTAQMMDEEESDIYACEMFSLQRPSRIVRAMTWLQRILRQRRRRGVKRQRTEYREQQEPQQLPSGEEIVARQQASNSVAAPGAVTRRRGALLT